MDRAIILDLRRKLPHEDVERLRYAEPELFPALCSKLARWTGDNREAVCRARPSLPAQLNDRAQDNWESLLAIADVAGGVWPNLARQAALTISTGGEGDNLTLGAELLADIKDVFEAKSADRISTADLIAALIDDDEKPWATYNRGKPISPRQIAKRLGGYGIRSKTIRLGFGIAKGFEKAWFEDAFSRYLSVPPDLSVTKLQTSNGKGFRVTDSQNAYVTKEMLPLHVTKNGATCQPFASVTDVTVTRAETETIPEQIERPNHENVTDKNFVTVTENLSVTRKPSDSKGCNFVTDKKGVADDSNVWGVTEI
jgi:putative DNA primase/helicase